MGLFRRRPPLYGRPYPFVGGALLFTLGLWLGLGWAWNWSLQTGNVFLLLMLPRSVLHTDGPHLLSLGLAATGILAVLRYGLQREAATRAQVGRGARGWRAATFRFYPYTFLFGLFLVSFGAIFLFDASVYGDKAPGGFVAFVYLNYAGLLDRPLSTGVGLGVLALGVACATRFAFQRGLGGAAPVPTAPPPRPEPPLRAPPPLAGPAGPAPAASFAPRRARDVLGAPPSQGPAAAPRPPALPQAAARGPKESPRPPRPRSGPRDPNP